MGGKRGEPCVCVCVRVTSDHNEHSQILVIFLPYSIPTYFMYTATKKSHYFRCFFIFSDQKQSGRLHKISKVISDLVLCQLPL